MHATSPTIRFPSFNDDWKEQRLGKFFTSSRSKGSDGMPTLSVTLMRGLISRDDIVRKTETNLDADEHLLVREGDIAYNMMRMWQGAFGRSNREGIVSPAYVVLRPLALADSGYFEYAFRRARSIYLFWAYSYGLTNDRLRLYANDFLRIPFAAPTLTEQRKIADFLTALDRRIQQLNQKQALLEDYKKGVMQQIFAQALRFKDNLGNDFPNWQEKKFMDIFEFSTGKNIKQAEASPGFVTPCIRYGELYHMYNEVITTIINRTNIDESELKFSDGDEILLPSAGEDPLDIGSASALTIKGVAIGRTINILKPKENGVYEQAFVSYYINHELRRKISTLARGASISNVYNSDLKMLKIRLPSLPEQTKIANFLTALDRKIEAVSAQITHTQIFKKGLLQQMFV